MVEDIVMSRWAGVEVPRSEWFAEAVDAASTLKTVTEQVQHLLDAITDISARWPANLGEVDHTEFRRVIAFASMARTLLGKVALQSDVMEMVTVELARLAEGCSELERVT